MRIVKPAEVRRLEVLDCATRLFAQRGYEATTIGEIIAELKISKGAFYHHFASKDDLVEAIAANFASEAAAHMQSVLDDRSLDPFDRFSMFLSRMRNRKVEAAAQIRATFAPIYEKGNSQLYERTQAAVNAVIRPILARIIAEGIADRTFDASDPDETADIILHLMGSSKPIVAALYAAQTKTEIDREVARLVRRFKFLGCTIDRILGLPEGSIELVDEPTIRAMTQAWRQNLSAA